MLHTLPAYYYGKDKELEIIKQLFDLGLLFDVVEDINLVTKTFHTIAAQELTYRGQGGQSTAKVLKDSFHTACLIGMRGSGAEKEEYEELLSGIKKMANYVFVEHFTLDSAILCAAKVAYLTALIANKAPTIARFDPTLELANLAIQNLTYNRLNKVKKTSPEAFYYFYRAIESLPDMQKSRLIQAG